MLPRLIQSSRFEFKCRYVNTDGERVRFCVNRFFNYEDNTNEYENHVHCYRWLSCRYELDTAIIMQLMTDLPCNK